jgi:hypothetical protein
MPKQFEHDVSESVATVREAVGDGIFGGGQIENFRMGWAMNIWSGSRVHFWKRISIEHVRSVCGLVEEAHWTDCHGKKHPRLHGGGDFPKCRRCNQ